jgi:hypothetical protein
MMAERFANRLADLLQKQDPEERKEAMSEIRHWVWDSFQITVHNGSPEAFARNLFLDHSELVNRAVAENFDPKEVSDPADLVARLLPSDEHMM